MKPFVLIGALLTAALVSPPLPAQAQTYGGYYGGYGNNAYLTRALALRAKRHTRHAKTSRRKRHTPVRRARRHARC